MKEILCHDALCPPSDIAAPATKKQAKDGAAPQQPAPQSKSTTHSGREQPNKILFLTNLPEEINSDMLTMLFQQ